MRSPSLANFSTYWMRLLPALFQPSYMKSIQVEHITHYCLRLEKYELYVMLFCCKAELKLCRTVSVIHLDTWCWQTHLKVLPLRELRGFPVAPPSVVPSAHKWPASHPTDSALPRPNACPARTRLQQSIWCHCSSTCTEVIIRVSVRARVCVRVCVLMFISARLKQNALFSYWWKQMLKEKNNVFLSCVSLQLVYSVLILISVVLVLILHITKKVYFTFLCIFF